MQITENEFKIANGNSGAVRLNHHKLGVELRCAFMEPIVIKSGETVQINAPDIDDANDFMIITHAGEAHKTRFFFLENQSVAWRFAKVHRYRYPAIVGDRCFIKCLDDHRVSISMYPEVEEYEWAQYDLCSETLIILALDGELECVTAPLKLGQVFDLSSFNLDPPASWVAEGAFGLYWMAGTIVQEHVGTRLDTPDPTLRRSAQALFSACMPAALRVDAHVLPSDRSTPPSHIYPFVVAVTAWGEPGADLLEKEITIGAFQRCVLSSKAANVGDWALNITHHELPHLSMNRQFETGAWRADCVLARF